MGGCRCTYKGCIRATKNSGIDFHFFHYPIRDPDRCLKWIINAKKPAFKDLPDDQLRNKVVCQLHFEKPCFSNTKKRRLVHDAVPTLDGGCEDTAKSDNMDVQVLPSDPEGTVFTVDTSDTLTQVGNGDVQSYYLQNGNLIPSDLSNVNNRKSYRIYNANSVGDNITSEYVTSSFDAGNYNFLEKPRNMVELSNNQVTSLTYLPPPIYQPTDSLHLATEVNQVMLENQSLLEMDALKSNLQDSNKMKVQCLTKTIEKHSKEIASLKKILNRKMKKAKYRKRLNPNQIMHHLHGLIPSTLHGAVSLHLLKKDTNFNENEKDFLTSLYTASPAVYQVLLEKFKWNLPNSNVVEELMRM